MSTPRAKPAPNCAMVLFGANGDLTKRLIVPALYNLAKAGLLPEHLALIGVDHGDRTTEDWRKGLRDFLEANLAAREGEVEIKIIEEDVWRRVARCLTYMKAEFLGPETYERLAGELEKLDRAENLGGNVLFYLAVADRFFAPIVERLAQAGLTRLDGEGWRRVVVEKPFGHDLESALALNARLLKCLDESQIFRIDHFLGKETVQNIMALRFANGLFEPVWHRDRIDHVQVTVAEAIGIEGRGRFYEPTGALRDMVPNHLFQLVAMTAMEPPVSFDAEAVRAKKAEVFKAVQPVRMEDVVRGQYGPGRVAGRDVSGYREEPNVSPDSSTETYVAMKLRIDNWRWAGVPFYLRTGKRMPKRSTEIAIRFKQAPFALFRDTEVDQMGSDWLVLKIQPDEGIRLRFNAKRPGPGVALEGVAMDFKYKDWFKQTPNVGYETLLYDCFIGDATLFQRADQVEAAWAVVQPVLDTWSASPPKRFPNYEAGSEGPRGSDELIARDGRTWRPIH